MNEIQRDANTRIDQQIRLDESDATALGAAEFPPRERRESCTFECLSPAEQKIFVAQRDLLPPDLQAFLSPWSLEEYRSAGARLFLHHSLKAGYGLLNGELISVFSLPGAKLGRAVVLDAIERGAERLDCLSALGKLKELYESCGFVETQRLPWNDQYAPRGWNYARFGRPDLIFLEVPKV